MSSHDRTLAVYYDETCLSYTMPAGVFDGKPSPLLAKQIEQPEGPDRILNTRAILERAGLAGQIEWHAPHAASDVELLSFHTRPYLDRLIEADRESRYFSASTCLVRGELEIIRLAAGCAIDAARHVISGKSPLAYALSRPPGHHAQPDVADGYCYLNGPALAASEALNAGQRRVAVIDWDVHHGNGTQQGFYERDDVLTVSMHMNHGAWGSTHVQSGEVDETGDGKGEGYNLNLPLPFGAGDLCYNLVFAQCVAPAVRRFQPDLIVLANGQDANQFDPNGRQCVSMAGFHSLAGQLRELADETCGGRIVMTQEGGYNASYAPFCAYAVVAGLLDAEMEISDTVGFYPDDRSRAEREVADLVARHPLLD